MHVPKMLDGVLQLYGSLETVEWRSSPSQWSGFCSDQGLLHNPQIVQINTHVGAKRM